MKLLRLTCFALLAAVGVARAQDDEQSRRPPTEIPDFSNLDEYIYEPKSILTIGIRHLGPARTAFSGGGTIASTLDEPGPARGANLLRHYHDGTLQPDARSAGRTDNSGNPTVDPTSGNQIYDPIATDGRTNTWAYADRSQITDDGFLVYHTYSARVTDDKIRGLDTLASNGLDIATSRDMGKLFGTKIGWTLLAAVSVSDISAHTSASVRAAVSTDSDYYSLYGQNPPEPPYSSPSSKNVTLLDAAGKPLQTDDGVPQTVVVDTSVLIANESAARITTVATDETSVRNNWKLKGAFYTFRFGPSIVIPVFSRVELSLSAGPALIYSGTSYTVTQTLTPLTGTEITDTSTDVANKLLPGYFADASLQVNISDRTGFYAGAVFQSAGSFVQQLNNTTAQYSSKIDFGNMSGLRAGMTYRF
jgi:hypothetical protein